jgi:two-component system OmpR family response regulator
LRQRHPDLPVLVLSARDAVDDRVAGLQAGADDYVTKPFDLPELLARLQALLRRRSTTSPAPYQWAELKVDPNQRRAWVRSSPMELSGREWSLLLMLLEQRNQVVHKEAINRVWGDGSGETGVGNTIEVYIHRLRRKLEGSGLVIRTVRGLGYLMEAIESR